MVDQDGTKNNPHIITTNNTVESVSILSMIRTGYVQTHFKYICNIPHKNPITLIFDIKPFICDWVFNSPSEFIEYFTIQHLIAVQVYCNGDKFDFSICPYSSHGRNFGSEEFYLTVIKTNAIQDN